MYVAIQRGCHGEREVVLAATHQDADDRRFQALGPWCALERPQVFGPLELESGGK